MMLKTKDMFEQAVRGFIKAGLLLVVLPLSLFGILIFLDTHSLKPGDPIPDNFRFVFRTSEGELKVERWSKLDQLKEKHPGFTLQLLGPRGSFSPEGPTGPLVQFSVQQQTPGEDLVEVVWSGYQQNDANYHFTSRYTVRGQDVTPSYFRAFHVGQAMGTVWLTLLAWIVLGIGKGVVKVAKMVRKHRAQAEVNSSSQ